MQLEALARSWDLAGCPDMTTESNLCSAIGMRKQDGNVPPDLARSFKFSNLNVKGSDVEKSK